jgi:hypothetical protein
MTFNQQTNQQGHANFFTRENDSVSLSNNLLVADPIDSELPKTYGQEDVIAIPTHASFDTGDLLEAHNRPIITDAEAPRAPQIQAPTCADSPVLPVRDIADVVSSSEDVDETVSVDGFQSYVFPIASTDYKGLESIDPRLADRNWRLNNLYTVINEEGELVRFKMRPSQLKLLENLHYKNIILKARQLGFTTFICIFLLDYALFNKNKQIGIIAHTQGDAGVIFKKVKIAWDNVPEKLKGFLHLATTGDSKAEYSFTNGSNMRISTSLRSGTYQAVLVTEFGKICARFPEKAEEVITGTLPAVPAKGLVFMESTAEGEEGRFYDMCMEAMENKRLHRVLTVKDYRFHFFPWFENPAYIIEGDVFISPEMNEYLDKIERTLKITLSKEQRNWYAIEQKTLKNKMKQENPAMPDEAFLSSGNKLFSTESVERHRELYVMKPTEIDGDFVIYKRFVRSHLYVLGADVSQGVKRDSSTIVVIDLNTGETVMTYKSNTIDPVTFAHDIKKAALMYGGCIAAPESNNVGQTTCVVLNTIYTNIYTQVREGQLETVHTSKLGWLTTQLSKPRMMYELSEAIDDDLVHLLDEGIVIEAKTFNKEDSLEVNTTEKTTRHFDLLIATAIAWQMRTYVTRGLASPEEVAHVEERRATRLLQKKHTYR